MASLIEAAKQGDLERVKLLMLDPKNIDPNLDWANIVHIAEEAIYVAMLADRDYAFHKLWSEREAVGEIIYNNYLDIVKCIVAEGARLCRCFGYFFRMAVNDGNLRTAKYLVAEGDNIHLPNNSFDLHHAAGAGHLEMVKFLVSEGVDVNPIHQSPLSWARSLDVAKYLVSVGADVRNGISCWYKSKDILPFLLSKLTLMECDYNIESRLYKILPDDHDIKKMIDRIIKSRALMTQRLCNNVKHSDITIVCHDH